MPPAPATDLIAASPVELLRGRLGRKADCLCADLVALLLAEVHRPVAGGETACLRPALPFS